METGSKVDKMRKAKKYDSFVLATYHKVGFPSFLDKFFYSLWLYETIRGGLKINL